MRIILKVSIHGHHNLTPRRAKPGGKRSRLAGIFLKKNNPYPFILVSKLSQNRSTSVFASIINKNYFKRNREFFQYLRKLPKKFRQVFFFIVDGNHNRNSGCCHPLCFLFLILLRQLNSTICHSRPRLRGDKLQRESISNKFRVPPSQVRGRLNQDGNDTERSWSYLFAEAIIGYIKN